MTKTKKATSKAALLAVKLERSKSDSRAMHLAAQRKVEDFFRRTGEDDIDEREVHRLTTRKTRARTTVMECRDDAKAAKIIDLKNLRNGGKRPGWHLENDASTTRQQEEEASRQGTMGMTSRTTSTGTTATRSIPSEPHNYVLSPEAVGNQAQLEEKARARAPKAKASTGRRADNLSLTPTLARLSANESPVSLRRRSCFLTRMELLAGRQGSLRWAMELPAASSGRREADLKVWSGRSLRIRWMLPT